MAATFKTALTGAKLQAAKPLQRNANRTSSKVVAMAGTKKVNSYDEDWQKGFFGTGLFVEDREASSKSAYKKIEEKKLLSSLESAGILSKLEKAGFTLTKIEQAGLLSTAEKYGLLSLAEDLLTANPATIASGSLPFIVAAIGALVFIPHDNAATSFISYTLGAAFAGVATAAVVGGFVVAAIQED